MSSSIRARLFFLLASLGLQSVALPTYAQADAAPADDCASKFESSQKLRKEGKLMAAADASIACSQPSCPAFIARECTSIYSEVQASLPSFIVRATEGERTLMTDVTVYVDGELLATTLDGRAVPIDPGVHEFRFVPKGRPEQSQKVLIAEGEKNKIISADFAKKESETAAPKPMVNPPVVPADATKDRRAGPPLGTYMLGGVGVVAIGAGIALRLIADKDYDDAERSCAPGCSKSTTDSIDLKYNLSIASFAVGGAAVAAAGVVWLVTGSGSNGGASTQSLSLRPSGARDGMLAVWRGNF